MKSTWLSFAVSDSRQYSYINVTLGAAGISPALEMILGDFVIRTSHSSRETRGDCVQQTSSPSILKMW